MVGENNRAVNNKTQTAIIMTSERVTTKAVSKRVVYTQTGTAMIVNPSVTEGRRRVRTLTKGTRAVRVTTAIDKTTSLVRTSIINGSPTINKQARDNTSKKVQT